jgi:Zn ribbon nucleic-acid-binding protein
VWKFGPAFYNLPLQEFRSLRYLRLVMGETWYRVCSAQGRRHSIILETKMAVWKGEADCPRCGGEGTLLVSAETTSVEIEGCWVCGFGKSDDGIEMEFIPLRKLRVTDSRKPTDTARGR